MCNTIGIIMVRWHGFQTVLCYFYGSLVKLAWVQVLQHQQAAAAAKAEAQAAQQELEEQSHKHDELYSQIASYKQHIDDLTEVMDGTEAARAAAAQESADLK